MVLHLKEVIIFPLHPHSFQGFSFLVPSLLECSDFFFFLSLSPLESREASPVKLCGKQIDAPGSPKGIHTRGCKGAWRALQACAVSPSPATPPVPPHPPASPAPPQHLPWGDWRASVVGLWSSHLPGHLSSQTACPKTGRATKLKEKNLSRKMRVNPQWSVGPQDLSLERWPFPSPRTLGRHCQKEPLPEGPRVRIRFISRTSYHVLFQLSQWIAICIHCNSISMDSK